MKLTEKNLDPLGNLIIVRATALSSTILTPNGVGDSENPGAIIPAEVLAVGPGEINVHGERIPIDNGTGGALTVGDIIFILGGTMMPLPDTDGLCAVAAAPGMVIAVLRGIQTETLKGGAVLIKALN